MLVAEPPSQLGCQRAEAADPTQSGCILQAQLVWGECRTLMLHPNTGAFIGTEKFVLQCVVSLFWVYRPRWSRIAYQPFAMLTKSVCWTRASWPKWALTMLLDKALLRLRIFARLGRCFWESLFVHLVPHCMLVFRHRLGSSYLPQPIALLGAYEEEGRLRKAIEAAALSAKRGGLRGCGLRGMPRQVHIKRT